MKRIVVIALVFVFVMGTVCAFAMPMVSQKSLSLSFTGSTANCSMIVQDTGKNIDATMELWQGSTKLITWNDSKKSLVNINETYGVTSGVSYTLKGYGTINGVSFNMTPVTKTCP